MEKAPTQKRIWGYQHRGNGYGFWTLKTARKNAPQNACIYMKLDNNIIPIALNNMWWHMSELALSLHGFAYNYSLDGCSTKL